MYILMTTSDNSDSGPETWVFIRIMAESDRPTILLTGEAVKKNLPIILQDIIQQNISVDSEAHTLYPQKTWASNIDTE